jgi:type III secretory pathway component EscS
MDFSRIAAIIGALIGLLQQKVKQQQDPTN